jgi:acyl-coenzyme A synthetase/AMP-(fatty) acid ligase
LLVWYRIRRGTGPESWLGLSRKDDEVLCIRGEETLIWGEFRRQVAAKARVIGRAQQQVWIVSAPDAYDFAVDLLAVCLAGKSALVPQNHQPATLRLLEERHPEALVAAVMIQPAVDNGGSWSPVAGGTVSFHTSGSTGEPKLITRSLEALRQEAVALEAVFGERLGSAQVLGSVPHHFIYGAIFRILWPLQAGRVFHSIPFEDGYAVVARVRSGGDYALVGSPSMLERLPVEEVARLSGLRAVFSSGSLLRTEVALRWSGPIEIYGSTETSGVAWRRQVCGGEGWRPLPGVSVSVSADGRLRVDSPYVALGCELTSDAVCLRTDGTFDLLGRVDRIAKVEGRRVSLPELETLIEAHPWVARCVLVQPDGMSRLAGVLVLRPDLAEVDCAVLLAEIRARLVARHDAVVAPRRWKFLPVLPVDLRGKIDQRRLRELFDSAAKPFPPEACWPQLLGQRRLGENEVVVRLQVPAELPYFEGHFPGLPILPGMALLSWAELFASWFLGAAEVYAGVDNLKFTAAVYPGERLELALSCTAEGSVRFRYETNGQPKATGVLLPAHSTHAF